MFHFYLFFGLRKALELGPPPVNTLLLPILSKNNNKTYLSRLFISLGGSRCIVEKPSNFYTSNCF